MGGLRPKAHREDAEERRIAEEKNKAKT